MIDLIVGLVLGLLSTLPVDKIPVPKDPEPPAASVTMDEEPERAPDEEIQEP